MSFRDLSWPRHSRRLTLRPALSEDAAAVWTWQRLPEVTHWMTRMAGDQEAFADAFAAGADSLLVVMVEDRIVGTAKIAVQDGWAQHEVRESAIGSEAEIGWALDPAIHGRGLGTELAQELLAISFDELGLHRVIALCVADNVASARVMEKVGMRREGYFRSDALLRDGTRHDSYFYALLAEEWAAQQR